MNTFHTSTTVNGKIYKAGLENFNMATNPLNKTRMKINILNAHTHLVNFQMADSQLRQISVCRLDWQANIKHVKCRLSADFHKTAARIGRF